MHNITKKGFKSLAIKPEEQKRTVERTILHTFIDTCCNSKKIYRGLEKLDSYISKRHLFNEVWHYIPLQIGTEITQKLFAEYLKHELKHGDGEGLHRYYKDNEDKIKIVDTTDSDSYKYFFAYVGLRNITNNDRLMKEIAEEAALLHEEYYPEKKKLTADYFIKKFAEFKDSFDTNFESNFTKDFGLKENKIKEFSELAEKLNHRTDIESLRAKIGHKYFKEAPDAYKILLQAMYSNDEMFNMVTRNQEFLRFERDRGERSIESQLFKRKFKDDHRIVNLVITDDAGARQSIHSLKEHSKSTTFVLGSVGLAVSLKFLGLIKDLNRIASNILIAKSGNLEQEYETLEQKYIKNGRESEILKDDILDPRTETKYAIRFACVVKFGKWPDENKSKLQLN